MRLFLALFFDQNSLTYLKHDMAILQAKFPQFRFESVERLHTTLWFYGDNISVERESNIIQQLAQLPKLQSFDLVLSKPLYLPMSARPHVLAYEIKSSQLTQLIEKIDHAMQSIGLNRERAFLPHITLARFPSCIRPLPEIGAFRINPAEPVNHLLQPKELVLIQSVIGPKGSTYLTKWRKTFD